MYAEASISRKTVGMHRLIISARPGEVVDHIDGNGLNNCLSNLRIVTTAENLKFQKKHKQNKSGFKGVSLHACGKYLAQIRGHGTHIYLGLFSNKEDAARAYDIAALTIFGPNARINFDMKEYT